jgi:hypothetical protein
MQKAQKAVHVEGKWLDISDLGEVVGLNVDEIDNSQHIQPGKCGWYNVLTDWRQYKTTYQEEVFIPLWMLCHQSPQ